MPVRKYRRVEEMQQPLPGRPLDWQNLERAFELMDLAARMFPMRYPPGVRRFRALEDANRYRDALQTAQIRRARAV